MDEMITRFLNAVTNNIDIGNSLDDKINLINQNVQYNINLTWSILGVSIAIAGVALFVLSKSWVNKRVREELPKFVMDNPPILYLKGTLNKIQSVMSDSNQIYSEGAIDIDVEKYNIKDLSFLLELDLFYYEKHKFTITNEELDRVEENLKVKSNLEFYNYRMVEHGIRIWYREPYNSFGSGPEIIWTLKIPNPKYKNHTNQ